MYGKKQLILTTAMAATLAALPGCASNGGDDWDDGEYATRDTRVCVDEAGNRVADTACSSSYRGVGGSWFYFNRGSRLPYYGDSLRDKRFATVGSRVPRAGAIYASAPASTAMTRSAAVARGGFGSSSRSYGGGRS